MPAFEQSETVEGVTVTVSAAEGVFPETAQLSVVQAPYWEQQAVDAALESERPADRNVALSYTFDIKVLDEYGYELQPADRGF